MDKRLISVGLDVGTTSTQMVVSELAVANRASTFAVPRLQIAERRVIYKSPVHFTPLSDDRHIDAEKLRTLIAREYTAAGISRSGVDTGAAIITGETSRKENARAVLQALAEFAGDFVVATAGPDLESVLAAKGAGAVEYSQETGKTVLHMDIGGGTSNLALIQRGQIVKTACLNVGGRLLKMDDAGKVIYVSPVLQRICSFKVGDTATKEQVQPLAALLARALEMAAGLKPADELLSKLWTQETGTIAQPLCSGDAVLSFSGGVADCIETPRKWLQFGDIGPELGQAIRQSALCAGAYRLGTETIRATVIGAGSHATVLSGSTIYHKNIQFPLKNLPVIPVEFDDCTEQTVRGALQRQDVTGILYIKQEQPLTYSAICALADVLVSAGCTYVATGQDMAKALGQGMALRLGPDASCLCLDGLQLGQGDYLDVGAPIGPAVPAVIKTLIFEK